MSVIRVENVSKQYRLGMIGAGTLREDLQRWWHRTRNDAEPWKVGDVAGAGNGTGDRIWALRDVDFRIETGEVVGLVGENGAGKSTLLKILSRITMPTQGRIELHGRVGSLLEVGTGFHPELTGRENVFLNGAILGMTRSEIQRKFDDIVEFSGVQRFMDTPVKRYSSGMRVRLAFAIAAHLEPEILLVDEVLAVGDAAFQKRCLGKLDEVSKEGRTVIFVSHHMSAIASLCKRAILLKDGQVVMDGPAAETIDRYLSSNPSSGPRYGEVRFANASEDEPFQLLAVRTRSIEGDIRADFKSQEPVVVEFEFKLRRPMPFLKIGFELHALTGGLVFQTFHNDREELLTETGRDAHILQAVIPADLLNGGIYHIHPCATIHGRGWLLRDVEGPAINVLFDVPNPDYVVLGRPGEIAPLLVWQAPTARE
ncbi:MAG TPA: polysaccharide ABC transporter ATP-binding protein [Gemmatimonadota bacterium]|jgi:lipopolysaccharide transport system ATP-binding protein|nr:polysaccharide ABC transporter ATP-binding protein [Gemmatimonadota bacterium]